MFWRSLKIYLKLYFSFTRTEYTFLYSFLFIIGVFYAAPDFLKSLYPQVPQQNTFSFVDSFYNSLNNRSKEDYLSRLDKYIIKRYDTIKLFSFDPNTATGEQLEKLGLTAKQVKTILTYRSRGGKFLVKDDFRKIYGIRYRQYLILKPYINLPDKIQGHATGNVTDLDSESKAVLFAFDPNTISVDSLVLLGFSAKQAESIVRAREKGWHFDTKEDFHRLYAVDDQMYSRLKTYINLPDKKRIAKVDLNKSNADQLKKLPGIGEYYAKKIISYRTALGGFFSVVQLKEIYGFPPSVFAKIKPFVYVDTAQITKLNINKAGYKTLVAHPYINSEMAGWITRRRKRKPFTSVGELNQKGLVTPAQFEKLKHYLTVE